jgi:hypothetical protein
MTNKPAKTASDSKEFEVFGPTPEGTWGVRDHQQEVTSFATEAEAHEFVADIARWAVAELQAISDQLDKKTAFRDRLTKEGIPWSSTVGGPLFR